MLALVSTVRESDIERHLQAEIVMVKQAFALDHQTYARYGAFQVSYLNNLRFTDHPADKDLMERGYGASLTGSKFSIVHGDLVTEIDHRPYRSGFSRKTETVSTWVNTIHIHSKLRIALRQHLQSKTSSVHKKMTLSGITLHKKHVEALKNPLKNYGIDLLANSAPRTISNGLEVDERVYSKMIHVGTVCDEKLKEFIKNRLHYQNEDLFSPIKRCNLDTGIKKKKKTTPAAMTVLKEDFQAFGFTISKAINIEEAFSYPITSVPFSIATRGGKLRQSDNSSLRNLLLKDSNSIVTSVYGNFV